MNLEDIAAIAGVSIATVSRVLNNKEGVGKKKRGEIDKLLLEHGFYEKNIKVSENIKKIGVIIPDLQNPFFAEIVKRISENAFSKNYQTMIFDTNENFDLEKKAVEVCLKSGISGVIICVSDGKLSPENIKKFESAGIPFVLIDRELDFYYDGIFLDDFRAGFLATEALIKEGHQEIAILAGPQTLKNLKNRYKGYLHALKFYGIEPKAEYFFQGNLQFSGKGDEVKNIFSPKLPVTGIVSSNNFMTLELLKYMNSSLNHSGKKLSIIGFDNPDYFNILDLNISCVSRPVSKMGQLAAELLIDKIENELTHTEKKIIQPHLELKGSEKFIQQFQQ